MSVRHVHAKPGQYIAVHRNHGGGSRHNGNNFSWLKLIAIGVGIWLVVNFWQVIVALVITGVSLWLLWTFRAPIGSGICRIFAQLWHLCVMGRNKYQKRHANALQNDSSLPPQKKSHHRFVILLFMKILAFCLILCMGYVLQQPVRKNSDKIRFTISVVNLKESGTQINYQYQTENHPLKVSNIKFIVVLMNGKKHPFSANRLGGSISSPLFFEKSKIKDYEIQIETQDGEKINYLHSRDGNPLPSDGEKRKFSIGGILIVLALLFAGFEIQRNCNAIFQHHRKISFLTELVLLLIISVWAWWICRCLWGLIGGMLLYRFPIEQYLYNMSVKLNRRWGKI